VKLVDITLRSIAEDTGLASDDSTIINARRGPVRITSLWAAIQTKSGPFTTTSLRETFADHKIVAGSMRLPSAEGFVHLVNSLNEMVRYEREEKPAEHRKAILSLRLVRAVDELAEILPEYIALQRANLTAIHTKLAPQYSSGMKAIAKIKRRTRKPPQ
jgi:hypothetical protein